MQRLKKVLLLGDSIRMGYQPRVKEKLNGIAEVTGPEVNCQFSLYTLSSIAIWLKELGKPDIVHWNNGIHDAGHNPRRRPVQIPLNDYCANIKFILDFLRENSECVIFANSTPVHPDKPFLPDQWSWRNIEIQAYNNAASELMRKESIQVNDLYSIIASDFGRFLDKDQLHLSKEGNERCADAVAGCIMEFL